jgi:hypothetical protein
MTASKRTPSFALLLANERRSTLERMTSLYRDESAASVGEHEI